MSTTDSRGKSRVREGFYLEDVVWPLSSFPCKLKKPTSKFEGP